MATITATLGILEKTHTLVKSTVTRIDNFRNGPTAFQSLTEELKTLSQRIKTLERAVGEQPSNIQSIALNEAFLSLQEDLKRSNSVLDNGCSKAYTKHASGYWARLKPVLYRIVRATTISATLNALELKVSEVSSKTFYLCAVLSGGAKSESQHVRIDPLIDTRQESYRVVESTPEPSRFAMVNFDLMDADGKRSTPEGILKDSILSPESSVVAHCVVGMVGAGKTVALQSLAFDDDICEHFSDGIHYIVLGRGATESMVIGEIEKIMRLTGATASAVNAKNSQSLTAAMGFAVAWFEGKTCLFLVDDLWPTNDLWPSKKCEVAFLKDLRRLLRTCSRSRMAITTRSTVIAHYTERLVDFRPRDPLGAVSEKIFMKHAISDPERTIPQGPNGDPTRSITTIRTICAGLPLALAVTGHEVASLANETGGFVGACENFASQLEKSDVYVGEMIFPESASLNARIAESLETLEDGFWKLQKEHEGATDHTAASLYASFCVLRHQTWVPLHALSGMWNVDETFAKEIVRLFCRLSLCKITRPHRAQGLVKVSGLMLHDLQLDFCKRQAEKKIRGFSTAIWHTQLLNGYLEPETKKKVSFLSKACFRSRGECSLEEKVLDCIPRTWWSVEHDGYIHANLARHLISAGLVVELAAVLLDSRWTLARVGIGGISSLKSDFESFLGLSDEIFQDNVRESFELIWRVIQLSWERASAGERSFLFRISGRLFKWRKENAIVELYSKSVETHTPLSYLPHVQPVFADPRRTPVMEIPVEANCHSVQCSPCGQFVVAGAGRDVVVANASTGVNLKRFQGHSGHVTGVSFAVGATKVVSGSSDNSVAIWKWETPKSPAVVLRGHSETIAGIAVSSDAAKIFSCSHDCTVKIWDANTGERLGEFVQQCSVECVALSADGRYIAIGLLNGSLKVLDSRTGDTIFEDADAHESCISSVVFSGRDRRLATGSRDTTIRLWDTATWTSTAEPLQGHTERVTCVTFSPDGEQIASGCGGGFVRLWNANAGRNIWTSSNVLTSVRSVSFTPDGRKIVSGSLDGLLRIWEAP